VATVSLIETWADEAERRTCSSFEGAEQLHVTGVGFKGEGTRGMNRKQLIEWRLAAQPHTIHSIQLD
jgi:hypothetical protein